MKSNNLIYLGRSWKREMERKKIWYVLYQILDLCKIWNIDQFMAEKLAAFLSLWIVAKNV